MKNSSKQVLLNGDKWLRWWAKELERGFVDIGYRHHSAEQSMTIPSGTPIEHEPTNQELLCMEIMNSLYSSKRKLYVVARLEYREQAEWFRKCRVNGGWRNRTTGEMIKVDEPTRKDFIDSVRANSEINKTAYYSRLNSLRHKVGVLL